MTAFRLTVVCLLPVAGGVVPCALSWRHLWVPCICPFPVCSAVLPRWLQASLPHVQLDTRLPQFPAHPRGICYGLPSNGGGLTSATRALQPQPESPLHHRPCSLHAAREPTSEIGVHLDLTVWPRQGLNGCRDPVSCAIVHVALEHGCKHAWATPRSLRVPLRESRPQFHNSTM